MDELIQLLIACETLLRKVGEEFWADRLLKVIQKSDGDLDLNLVAEIITLYGGMGSFNDLVISLYNNHIVDPEDEGQLNSKLNKLRGEIYQEAIRLRKS